jgi:hypothetical protein
MPKAQLVFGTPYGPPRGGVDKISLPIDTRVKVFGKGDEPEIISEKVEASSRGLVGKIDLSV